MTLAAFAWLLFLPAVLVAIVLVIAHRRRARVFRDELREYPALAGYRRTMTGARLMGFGAAVVVIQLLLWLDRDGRLVAVTPAAVGLILIVATMIGQYRVRDAAREPGRASLESRYVGSYLPRLVTGMVAVGTVLLTALLIWSTSVASRTDIGRMAGYAYRCTVSQDGQEFETTGMTGPFPGSFYSLPMAASLILVGVVAAVALTLVASRPRNGANANLVRIDDALRRQTAEGIMASVGLAIGGSMVGIGMMSSLAVSHAFCRGASEPWFAVSLAVITQLVGWVLFVWSILTIITSTSGVSR